MAIISLKKYFSKLGHKYFAVPFFVLLTLLLTGYTTLSRERDSNNHDYSLQDENFTELLKEFPQKEFQLRNFVAEDDTVYQTTHRKLRRSKYRQFKSPVETVITLHDTISTAGLKIDSLKVDSLAIDSTARLKYFTYKRVDNYSTEIAPQRKFRLFAYPSDKNYSRSVKLDSSGQFVEIKESIGEINYKYGLKIPLDEYIELELDARREKMWRNLTSEYKMKTDEEELQALLSSITNIDIPLPSAGIFSIFGPPKISLRVNGRVDIHGAWKNEEIEGVTASLLGSTRNEPDFKQQVQINVQGTVGDKLTLSADWNTERDFEYENQLKIHYKGYEDEIIQSIEAGNVSLQASPLIGGSEALFGIKADFQMGAFHLTALASQKKGETEEVSLTGGSKAQTFEIRAYDYSKNHYFVHEAFTDRTKNIFNAYYGNTTPQRPFPQYKIKDIEVWKEITGQRDENERKVNAFVTLDSLSGTNRTYPESLRDQGINYVSGESVGSRFIKLEEGTHYTIQKDVGVVSFNISINESENIAAAIRMEGPTSSDDDDWFWGEFIQDAGSDPNRVLVLKLIKPANLQPSFKKAWKLQLRNIYPIGGKDVKKEGFVLDIKYQVEGQEARNDYQGIQLLQAFKLDQTDEGGVSAQPDGAFDFFPPRTINPSTGEIIFPVLEPFGRDLPSSLPEELRYLSVYDTTITVAKQDGSKDKFTITGEYSAAVTSTFNVGFNVVENSVKVFFNGNELEPGIDYTVDYLLGQVRIRKDEALVPGADLRITYEKNDLFQMASKTMLGLRGIYEFNERTKLGFSYLNLNQQTLSDKVRIGEEPLNNAIMGVDFQSDFDLPFITEGLDYILSTREMSNLRLNAEFAYMSPEPNTKKSTILGDDGKSIAYIDDFEGAKRIIPIGDSYSAWSDISVPNGMEEISMLNWDEQMRYKAQTYWYNITPSDVNVRQIWGNRKSVSREDEQQTVLDFVFDPSNRGMYNIYPDLSTAQKNWGGMMKRLSSTANNLTDENIEYIEMWVQVLEAPEAGAKLYIDLGIISEDVIPNGELDTEDENLNDQIDDDEDKGIDGLSDEEERIAYSSSLDDPANDNFGFNRSTLDYTNINKSEGSAQNVDRLLPDTEDLNRNSNIDRLNSYFRYELPLDTNSFTNPFVVGGGFSDQRWYLYRIPLKDYIEKIGDPSLSVVETIRIWTNGMSGKVHLRMLDINLVGNQWRKLLIPGKVTEEDEALTISIISIEDDPEYYSPPGLKQERDRTQTEYEVLKNEQSLKLVIKDLMDGDSREILKYLNRPLDLFNYKEMKMFYWGDSLDTPNDDELSKNNLNDPNREEDIYNTELFFRFGSDSLNYYEYRTPVKESWHEIVINFEELTSIKQSRDNYNLTQSTENQVDFYQLPVDPEDKPSEYYGVRGNPTLTTVKYFTIGVLNPDSIGYGQYVSGDLWINELRVLDADNTPGWAYKANASLKLADFVKVDVNTGQTDPYFHKLSDRFGNRIDSRDWGVTANVNLLKLIPFNLTGSNLNVSYSRKESDAKPLFMPGTDIRADEAISQIVASRTDLPAQDLKAYEDSVRAATETVSVSETWTLANMKIRIPSNEWYIRDIINGFTFSFNYNKTSSRNPTTLSNNSWRWDASANYALSLGPSNFFEPAKWPIIGYVFDLLPDYKTFKFFWVPQTFSLGMSANRRRSFTQSRAGNAPNIQRDFTTSRNSSFSWRITEGGLLNANLNYNLTIKSSLVDIIVNEIPAEDPEQESTFTERPEAEIWKDIFSKDYFGKDYDYSQRFDLTVKPKLPTLFDIDRTVLISAGYSVQYNWLNNFQQEDLGRSAKYTNRLNTSLTVKLKQLFDPLFEDKDAKSKTGQMGRKSGPPTRGRPTQRQLPRTNTVNENDQIAIADSVLNLDSLQLSEEDKESFLDKAWEWTKAGTRWIFFDYDQINITYNYDDTYGAGGLKSTTHGFSNFWGINYHDFNGPSRMFMLGMTHDAGPRAADATIQDTYVKKNSFDLKTSRKLWDNASINLSWHLDFGENGNSRFTTDSLGNYAVSEISSTGTLNKTFVSFPKEFPFSFLGGKGIEDVKSRYDTSRTLSEAFIEGFETLPILSKLFGEDLAKYIPRPNWSFTWNGLEKIGIFDFADKLSLNHAYTSSFTEGWKVNPDGVSEVQTRKITYGFSPLIGISFGMKNLLGGNLNSTIKYSTQSTYNLAVSTGNITEDFSNDISISLSYSKKGFELPLFGIAFKNDLEIILNYTQGRSATTLYNIDQWNTAENSGNTYEPVKQNGQIRTQLEPRVQFDMSSTVTASIFYKRTTFVPEGAARKPPTTTNEMGVDITIQIR